MAEAKLTSADDEQDLFDSCDSCEELGDGHSTEDEVVSLANLILEGDINTTWRGRFKAALSGAVPASDTIAITDTVGSSNTCQQTLAESLEADSLLWWRVGARRIGPRRQSPKMARTLTAIARSNEQP